MHLISMHLDAPKSSLTPLLPLALQFRFSQLHSRTANSGGSCLSCPTARTSSSPAKQGLPTCQLCPKLFCSERIGLGQTDSTAGLGSARGKMMELGMKALLRICVCWWERTYGYMTPGVGKGSIREVAQGNSAQRKDL